MRRRFFSMAGITLASVLLLSSCIGSFNLSNKVLAWNKTATDSKFVNEVVFLALSIVPVYGVCLLADGLVLNSIEFWTGDNPVEAGLVKEVKGDKGNYTVETLENGYNIKNESNQEMNLIYDKETKTWSAESDGESTKVLTFEGENEALVYLPDGNTQRVDLSSTGVLALRQAVMAQYFAAR